MQADSLPSEPQGSPKIRCRHCCPVAQACPLFATPWTAAAEIVQMKTCLFQSLQVVRRAGRQQHHHVEPLRVRKLQDLRLELVHEAGSGTARSWFIIFRSSFHSEAEKAESRDTATRSSQAHTVPSPENMSPSDEKGLPPKVQSHRVQSNEAFCPLAGGPCFANIRLSMVLVGSSAPKTPC